MCNYSVKLNVPNHTHVFTWLWLRLLLGWRQNGLAFFISLTLSRPCNILLQPDYTLLCPVMSCYNPVTSNLHPVIPPRTLCYAPAKHSYTQLRIVTPCYNPFTPSDTPAIPCHTSLHLVTPLFHPWSPLNLVTLVAFIILVAPKNPKRAATRPREGPRLYSQEGHS